MQPLYKIANEYLKVYDEFMSIPDLPQEAVNDTLESIVGDFENKVINVAAFIKNLQAEAEAIKNAEKNMQERRRVIENKAESLENYLMFNLAQCHINEIKSSPMFLIKLKDNPPSVIIENENDIPNQYKNIEVIEKIDKMAIKKSLSNGEPVPGARLEQKKSLSIK